MNHQEMPLFNQLKHFAKQKPISFHVPGHKNGRLFLDEAREFFDAILPIDVTELTGLDDLHAAQGVILEAEKIAAEYFKADHTFFLIGGSTVGNLAMILTTCSPGDKIIVQRNSHKSILNGLELSGAKPIFISPEYDETVFRYTAPSYRTVEKALLEHPDAKGLVLTYPDYFGHIFDLKKMIDLAHQYQIPVLVDEAHGVHFSLGQPFPTSAVTLGADLVVQSAHKMAPAMTMASFLHMKSALLAKDQVSHYLQMLQSSSPSYPLMASLDVARAYLATLSKERLAAILASANQLRKLFTQGRLWDVLPGDDPLKITLHVRDGYASYEIAREFEKNHIYPEFVTDKQLLFIHGLEVFQDFTYLEDIVKNMNEEYKYKTNHATIEIRTLFKEPIQELAISYHEMFHLSKKKARLEETVGSIAAEAVIPYPPGIPVIAKGERITEEQIRLIRHLIQQGATIQHQNIEQGIEVFE
jgi:arginine decarboxylase